MENPDLHLGRTHWLGQKNIGPAKFQEVERVFERVRRSGMERVFERVRRSGSMNRGILEALHPKERLRLAERSNSQDADDPIPGFWNTTPWEDDLKTLEFCDRKLSVDDMQSLVQRIQEEDLPDDTLLFHCCIIKTEALKALLNQISNANDIKVHNIVLSSVVIRDEDWCYIADIWHRSGAEKLLIQDSMSSPKPLAFFRDQFAKHENFDKVQVLALQGSDFEESSEMMAKEVDKLLSVKHMLLVFINGVAATRKDEQLLKLCNVTTWITAGCEKLLNCPQPFMDLIKEMDGNLTHLGIDFESNMDDYTGAADFISGSKVKNITLSNTSELDLLFLSEFLETKQHSVECLFCTDSSTFLAVTKLIMACKIQRLMLTYDSVRPLKRTSLCDRGMSSFRVPELLVSDQERALYFYSHGCLPNDDDDSSSSDSSEVSHTYSETYKFLDLLSMSPKLTLCNFPSVDEFVANYRQITSNPRDRNRYTLKISGADLIITEKLMHNLVEGDTLNLESFHKVSSRVRNEASELRAIDLSHQPMTKYDIWDLKALLRFCDSLSQIVLRDCGLTGSNVMEILEVIENCEKKLLLLDLSNNPDLGKDGAKAIANLLKRRHVENICVVGCKLQQWHDDIIAPTMLSLRPEVGTKVTYAEDKVNFTINEGGGAVEFISKKCSITFPPSSVKEPTNVTFRLKDPGSHERIPKGLIPVSPILECTPSGIEFECPVVVRLGTWVRPVDKTKCVNLTIISRESAGDDWSAITLVQHGACDYAEFETYHFSDFEAVLDVENSGEVNANYCTMLFLPRDNLPFGQPQHVTSWFVPNNPVTKETTKAEMQAVGMVLYQGAGAPIQITAIDDVFVSVTSEADTEPVTIRPNHPIQRSGAHIIENRAVRVNFLVKLVYGDDVEEEKSADLSLHITKGVQPMEDPFVLTWTPRNRMVQRPVYNVYNTFNITGSNVNITSVTQELISSTVTGEQRVEQMAEQVEEVRLDQ